MNTKEKVLQALEQNKGLSISGAQLAESLGVSRNAIWKAVKGLQSEGVAIEATTNKGYCIPADTDMFTVQSIKDYLSPKYKEIDLEVHKVIDSTNTRAKEYASEGRGEVTVIVAEQQTAGRGRRGRSFYSPKGTGVYISFLLRPAFSFQETLYLTTAAAVAAAKAIEEATGIEAGIKWVNDVFCHGKKVCGILTEASLSVETGALEYAVTGIGFNIREPEGGFPEEIRDVAGPILLEEHKDPAARSKIAAGMINHFLEYYEHLTERTYMEEYKKRSFLLGREIYTLTEPPVYGRAIDIDSEGHLIMQLPDGTREVLSAGEVSVRDGSNYTRSALCAGDEGTSTEKNGNN